MRKTVLVILTAVLVLLSGGCGNSEKVFEVRYELNGGTLVSGELLQKVEEGGSAVEPTVERDGYALIGWSEPATDVKDDMVIVALWKQVFTVTFDPDGGSVKEGELSQTLFQGDLPEAPSVEKDRMIFAGWNPEIKPVDGDITYIAKWDKRVFSAKELYQTILPGVVEVSVYDSDGRKVSLGSGFFINNEGTVATNYHVVEGAYAIKILLSSGEEYDVLSILDYSESKDLAVLETGLKDNEYLIFDEDGVETGDTVYAIGSSQGLTGSLSDGIVATSSREFEDVRYIQTTAPISPGNSGGPLINVYGEVIGINTMSLTESQNLNFAIDISELEQLDGDGPKNMTEFYEATNLEFILSREAKEFLASAQDAEVESNDSLVRADLMNNGSLIAGALSSSDDLDYYYYPATRSGKLLFEVIPQIKRDADVVLAGVFVIGDEKLEYIDTLQIASGYDYNVERVLEIDAQAGQTYVLLVMYDDDYPFEMAPLYMARVRY